MQIAAMPGNQGNPDGDVELKVSYMVKRSQGKSAIGATNFKKRVFVLTPSRLSYFEGTLEVSIKKARLSVSIWKGGRREGVIDIWVKLSYINHTGIFLSRRGIKGQRKS